VVEGSVRKAGDRVRITAQLIDASTNAHVWADRYDRHLREVFAIQDEIIHEIVSALRLQLAPNGVLGFPSEKTGRLKAAFSFSGARSRPSRLWGKVRGLMSST
jgi:adenylate cyclase